MDPLVSIFRVILKDSLDNPCNFKAYERVGFTISYLKKQVFRSEGQELSEILESAGGVADGSKDPIGNLMGLRISSLKAEGIPTVILFPYPNSDCMLNLAGSNYSSLVNIVATGAPNGIISSSTSLNVSGLHVFHPSGDTFDLQEDSECKQKLVSICSGLTGIVWTRRYRNAGCMTTSLRYSVSDTKPVNLNFLMQWVRECEELDVDESLSLE